MTAVWYRFRAELRSRWWAWLGLGLLVGLAAGAVMALAAGARRTDSAYARFLDTHDAYDAMVFDFGQPGSPGVGGFDKVMALPSVEDSAEGDLGAIPLGDSHVVALARRTGGSAPRSTRSSCSRAGSPTPGVPGQIAARTQPATDVRSE
jgi:hypothetical protein